MLIHIKKQVLTTSLSKERVLEKIKGRIPSRLFASDSEFFGSVSDDKFKVRKNYHYNSPVPFLMRNSFMPIAVGRVEECDGGSVVKIKVRMALFVQIFMLFIELFMLAQTLFGVIFCIIGDLQTGVSTVFCGGIMFLSIELLLYFAFSRPAKTLIERLDEILVFSKN